VGSNTSGDQITDTGTFSLTGGTFTSTRDSLDILGAATSTFLGGTFNNNSGTVTFGPAVPYTGYGAGGPAARSYILAGSATFNNLIFGSFDGNDAINDTFIISTGTILTTKGYFFIYNYPQGFIKLLGGGELEIQGDLEESGEQAAHATGTVAIVVDGAGAQTIGAGDECTALDLISCVLVVPNLTIAKTSGSALLDNIIVDTGDWTNSSTITVDPGGSSVSFGYSYPYVTNASAPATFSTHAITGSTTFNNLIFSANDGGFLAGNFTEAYTIATGTVLTAKNSLYINTDESTVSFLGGGEVEAKGNIDAGYEPQYATGTTSFVIDGTSTQIIGADDLCNCIDNASLILPGLTVNKTAGVAYMGGINWNDQGIYIIATTTVSQGELSLATGTTEGSVRFDGNVIVNAGTTLSDYTQTTSTIILGGNITNNGLLFFAGDGLACTVPPPDYISIESTSPGTQRTWSGTGNFVMRYVNLTDQSTTVPITVYNGTNAGNVTPLSASGWNFVTNGRIELLQSASSSSNSASTLALPSFGIVPRTGDLMIVSVSAQGQGISAPTDNAGNTYTLVASSTFGSEALALYYAKGIASTSSFDVTLHGTGNAYLSGAAFEYTGVISSSTLAASSSNTVYPATSTSLTSFSAAGQSADELYFGTMSLNTPTTASPGSGWTERADVENESTLQSLYDEEISTTTQITTAATWSAAAATSYAAILGIFRSPYLEGYEPSGYVDSVTFDTKDSNGAQLNSYIWQGTVPSNSAVKFQFAGSNSPAGPWNYVGPNGVGSYFPGPGQSGNAGASVSLLSTTNGYALFTGYRYYRYRVTLFSDSEYTYTPTVSGVTLNWSP